MDENLTDEQQADRVRQWLLENGPFILGGLLLGVGGLFGWNWWQDAQVRKGIEAAGMYQQVIEAVQSSQPVRAAELEDQLESGYSGTPYVDLSRFAIARMYMDRNEPGEAAVYLEEIVDSTGDLNLQRVAQLRLARVFHQMQDYEAGLAALQDIDENSAFATRFHEVRGDLYAAMGRTEEARAQYEEAINAVEPGVIDRGYVQAKLNSLGPPPAAPVSTQVPSADQPDTGQDPAGE